MTAETHRIAGEPDEQREFARVAAALSGTLFVPAENFTSPCRIHNLSGGGASIDCDQLPPLNAFAVLHVEGFGRFNAVIMRHDESRDGELGLHFVCTEARRAALIADLARYVESGLTQPTRQRRHARVRSVSIGCFTRADGSVAACEVADISLQGLSLRTRARPPVGEIVNLGETRGRVVRHHDDGIAIHYLPVAAVKD